MSSKPVLAQPSSTSSTRQIYPIPTSIPTTPQDNPSHISLDINQICPICTEDYPLNDFQAPLNCKHSFCSPCLKQYLTVKINSNQILNIPCPQSGCQEIFTSSILEGIIEPEIYAKYRELVLKKVVHKNFQKNLCPNPDCARQFSPVQNQDFSHCAYCEMKICNLCMNPFHEGKSCMQVVNPDFVVYAKVHGIKFCPVCKTIIPFSVALSKFQRK